MHKILFLVFLSAVTYHTAAQGYEDLDSLTGFGMSVYYSPGNQQRAEEIASLCKNAYDYTSKLLESSPQVYLFVIDSAVWKKYGKHPLFGMPHSFDAENGGTNLVVASRDNTFWKSFIPPLDNLPSSLADKVKSAYTDSSGQLSMKAFFDLLAVHELGHSFHVQEKVDMQRLWIQELFVNMILHTYIAENEPGKLPPLVVFPEMVISSGTEGFKYTSLADFEERYDNMSGRNYGWYQSKLHSAAKDIHDEGGTGALIKLWNGLKKHDMKLSDEELLNFLKKEVHPEVANVITEW
jgi:hypothetical protein